MIKGIQNELLDGFHPAFFSARMKKVIQNHSIVRRSKLGRGLYAARSLEQGVLVGYYSGPVLTWNNISKYESEEHFIAAGTFIHPGSGKKMTYHFMVIGPTRYMNHGHRPDDFTDGPPQHSMVANTRMMREQMLKIQGRYRPVYAFRTRQKVKQGEELLYDYGVHREELFFEVLRRNKQSDSVSSRKKFDTLLREIEKARFGQWKASRDFNLYTTDWDILNEFHGELLVGFINSPETHRVPTRDTVPVQ